MDSISLRLHLTKDKFGIFKEAELMNALMYQSELNTQISNKVDIQSHKISIISEHINMLPLDYMVRQYHFLSDDKRLDIVQGRLHLPSSHYDIGYRINIEKECIDFSFSIPKYVYGHSVAQFCPNPHLNNRIWTDFSESFNDVSKHWFNLLVKVVKDFFNHSFIGFNIDFTKVEIVRLDLAFNQYFKSKEEAIRVAELMSEKRISSLKGKKGRKEYRTDEHSTGFASISRNSYYKVYHKGTEFKTVGDRKRLERENRITHFKKLGYLKDLKRLKNRSLLSEFNGKNEKLLKSDIKRFKELKRFYNETAFNFFDIEALQDEADLILRHEIRFVSKSMSRIFKKEVFRNNDKDFKALKNRFKKLDSKRQRFDRNGRSIDKLTIEELKDYDYGKKVLDKRHRFYLKSDTDTISWMLSEDVSLEETKRKNKGKFIEENFYNNVHFNKELLSCLIDKFYKIIVETQISEFSKWDTLKNKIDAYNNDVRKYNNAGYEKIKEISYFRMRNALRFIKSYSNLDTAYQKGELSKSTYYQMRKELKLIGYSDVMILDSIKIDTSFESYFKRCKGYGVNKPIYNALFGNMLPRHRKYF